MFDIRTLPTHLVDEALRHHPTDPEAARDFLKDRVRLDRNFAWMDENTRHVTVQIALMHGSHRLSMKHFAAQGHA